MDLHLAQVVIIISIAHSSGHISSICCADVPCDVRTVAYTAYAYTCVCIGQALCTALLLTCESLTSDSVDWGLAGS